MDGHGHGSKAKTRSGFLVKEAPSWAALFMTIGVALTSGTVWAYSTFVTRQERNDSKAMYDQRIILLESHYDSLSTAIAKMDGKLDSVILIQRPPKNR